MSVRFRLARVLGLRTRLREQAQDTVQESAAALAAAGERIDAARAVQDSVRAAEDASAAIGIRGADLARSRAYEASLALEEAAHPQRIFSSWRILHTAGGIAYLLQGIDCQIGTRFLAG